jgi:nucleoside-diphosphate-sugar epimerase
MKTAFVTGATGFLGLNVVEQLKAAGWRVVAIHRANSNTKYLAPMGAELAACGIDDAAALSRVMPEGVDAVFHIAGDLSWSKLHKKRQFQANVVGTRNVVEAALARGAKRFVHTSSVAAFGILEGRFDETSPSRALESGIGYLETKFLGEEEVRKGVAKGLSAVILNPANIMGPYDTTSWARLFRMMRDRKLPGIPRGGGSFCHVREVARAHLEAVTRGGVGENYILAGTDASYAEVCAIAAELLHVSPPRTLPPWLLRTLGHLNDFVSLFTRKEPDLTAHSAFLVSRHFRADSSKAERELGYKSVPLREMIEDSFRWLKAEALI